MGDGTDASPPRSGEPETLDLVGTPRNESGFEFVTGARAGDDCPRRSAGRGDHRARGAFLAGGRRDDHPRCRAGSRFRDAPSGRGEAGMGLRAAAPPTGIAGPHRPLPHQAGHRLRRHGHRLRGGAGAAAAHRRPQGDQGGHHLAVRPATLRVRVAEVLARLRHPGIAQVYEAGTHDDGSGGVPLLRDGVRPGRADPHRVRRDAPGSLDPRAARAVRRGLRRRPPRPPEGDHPPRPQAGEHPRRLPRASRRSSTSASPAPPTRTWPSPRCRRRWASSSAPCST